jgi:hypothetical protein
MSILHHDDIKFTKWIAQKGLCEVCGEPLSKGQPQLAHKLEKSKPYLKKYGVDIIDHPLNLELVCSLHCNQSVLIGKAKDKLIAEHVRKIKEQL